MIKCGKIWDFYRSKTSPIKAPYCIHYKELILSRFARNKGTSSQGETNTIKETTSSEESKIPIKYQTIYTYVIGQFRIRGEVHTPFPSTKNSLPLYVAIPSAFTCISGLICSHICKRQTDKKIKYCNFGALPCFYPPNNP